VALKNLEILEREDVAKRARAMGDRLIAGLEALRDLPCVGDVRGLGLMAAVEFVADRDTKAPAAMAEQVLQACLERGLITRVKGESLLLAPPLVISGAEVDQVLAIVRDAIEVVWHDRQSGLGAVAG
jgi:adenosylmethionine-8-amino-7-oxononanoate aminotransferase